MLNKKWNKGLRQMVMVGVLILSLMYVGCTEVAEESTVQMEEEINESNNTLIEEIIETNNTPIIEWLTAFPTHTDMEKELPDAKILVSEYPSVETEEEYHGQDHEYWD